VTGDKRNIETKATDTVGFGSVSEINKSILFAILADNVKAKLRTDELQNWTVNNQFHLICGGKALFNTQITAAKGPQDLFTAETVIQGMYSDCGGTAGIGFGGASEFNYTLAHDGKEFYLDLSAPKIWKGSQVIIYPKDLDTNEVISVDRFSVEGNHHFNLQRESGPVTRFSSENGGKYTIKAVKNGEGYNQSVYAVIENTDVAIKDPKNNLQQRAQWSMFAMPPAVQNNELIDILSDAVGDLHSDIDAYNRASAGNDLEEMNMAQEKLIGGVGNPGSIQRYINTSNFVRQSADEIQFETIAPDVGKLEGDFNFQVEEVSGELSVPIKIRGENTKWKSTKSFGENIWGSISETDFVAGNKIVNIHACGNRGEATFYIDVGDPVIKTLEVKFEFTGFIEETFSENLMQSHDNTYNEFDDKQAVVDNISVSVDAILPWLSSVPFVGPVMEASANTANVLVIDGLNRMINRGKSKNYEHSLIILKSFEENFPERTPEGDAEFKILEVNPGSLLRR
jgi:hypothetical protein